MEDVTDTAFREIIMSVASPDNLHVLFTEFTSTDGIHPVGKETVRQRLKVSETEHQLLKEKNIKLVAQIWGNNPEKYYQTIKLIEQEEFPFHGIDINLGCPVKKIVSQGCCSALIKNPSLAQEILIASREATSLPLSVKTRIGFKTPETENWISHLLKQPIDAIILHGRTQKQMSEGKSDWNEIEKAVQLKNKINPRIKLIGNGDILTLKDAKSRINSHGVDGVMIGRGIFNNPWLFSGKTVEHINQNDRIKLLIKHAELFWNTWGETKNFALLRRFFKIYISNFRDSSLLRHELMQTQNIYEVYSTLEKYSKNINQLFVPKNTWVDYIP